MICTDLVQIGKFGTCVAVRLIDYEPGLIHALFIHDSNNLELSQNDLYDPYERREFLIAVRLNKIPFELRNRPKKVKVIIGCIDHLEEVVEALIEIFPKSKITLCVPFKEALGVVRNHPNVKTFIQRKYGISIKSFSVI